MNVFFRETDMTGVGDCEAVVRLLNEFMHIRSAPDVREIDGGIIPKLKKLGTAKIYLCENGGQIIGIAVCFVGFSTYRQKELLNIHDIYIRDEYQRKGIGTEFLKYIESECMKNGFCRITLEVYGGNVNAVKAYEKCGFVGNKGAQEVIYAMKKDLT
jgi:GNAT superfamily N-acetyltransferase